MGIIDVLAGVIIAALAGMGIGGGGLLVLYLLFIKDMGQVNSQGINLIFFICAGIASLLYHRNKRRLNKRLTVSLIVFGVLGAVSGAYCASIIEPGIIRKIFGWLLIISGLCVVFKKDKGNRKNKFKKGVDKRDKIW